MCRILSYLGKPIVLEELLYKPDNSFIKQSYYPKYMSHLLNLAGFGLVAWDKASNNPVFPYIYKTYHLPFYDENLKNFSAKLTPYCFLSHIRGVSYTDNEIVSLQNVHPFIYPKTNLALAHNGSLVNFSIMKYDLLDYVSNEYLTDISGTTDSEWIYALFLTQMKDKNDFTSDNIIKAVFDTLKIIQNIRNKHNIETVSPVNLFISDGKFIAATRFVFDYGWMDEKSQSQAHSVYHSLWYTYGENYGFHENEYKMKGGDSKSSIIIASEPLTEDTTTWIEVPEYTVIVARFQEKEINITSRDINL